MNRHRLQRAASVWHVRLPERCCSALVAAAGEKENINNTVVLSACTTTTQAVDDNLDERIWQETTVDIMGRRSTSVEELSPEQSPTDATVPAVIYLHGCGGRGNTATSHVRFFKLQGYAVFSPDHYVRPDAKTECDYNTARVWATKSTREKRIEEAEIVRQRLRSLSWVDQYRVYLVGHSQGGWAAAHYRKAGDFTGIIAIATACGEGIEHHTPLLTIAAKRDEFAIKNNAITCAEHYGRKATHLVVEGGDHNFIMDTSYLAEPEKQARDSILSFLESTAAN